MTGDPPESHANSLQPANPFSTRAVRPGALGYRFPPHDSLAQLLARLEERHGWGEIVGPHGAGKSTLAHEIEWALVDAGRQVCRFTLTQGQRQLPDVVPAGDEPVQVIVDGFEQLGWWQRRAIKRACRRRGDGLLITAHTSFGFPPLVTAGTSVELTQYLVATLLPGTGDERISPADIQEAFQRHAGNLREVFFDLYDLWEQRSEG